MGSNALSKSNVERLSARLGLDLDRVLCWADGRYASARTTDHQHVTIDRRTDQWWPEQPVTHWTSCPLFGRNHP